MIPFLVIAAISSLAAATGAAQSRRRGIRASAAHWAKIRGLPLPWVLATITVESGGRPHLRGDDGVSYGLMQVNTRAHAGRLKALGISPEQLLDVDTNIMVGTKLLREAWDTVVKALAGRTPPAPIDVLVRLAYKGPGPVGKALREGRDPRNLPWTPSPEVTVANWRKALAKTAPLV